MDVAAKLEWDILRPVTTAAELRTYGMCMLTYNVERSVIIKT
jgi:hypothetical protein